MRVSARHLTKLAAAACVLVSGCQTLPGEGPTAGDILNVAGKSGVEQHRYGAIMFEVVEVDSFSARLVSAFTARLFQHRFGIGGPGHSAVLGVGDHVRVEIFEAGENGLFSTTESKRTTLEIVVQPNGKAPIPYVGSVQFAGRTPEQVRQTILSALRDRAVEPDVILTSVKTDSRVVTVSGAVGASGQIPLDLDGDRISDVIAKAGGPTADPFETHITLARGSRTATVLLSTIIANPSENIFVRPGDQIFVSHDPQTFTILGQTVTNNRIEFGSRELNLLEAIALAGGGSDNSVNAGGYFIFRYEDKDVVELLVGERRFAALLKQGYLPDSKGRYPVVFRFDMRKPDSLIAGQLFPIRNRDVIYAARHPAVDFQKVLTLVAQPIGLARGTIAVAQ